MRTSRGLGFAVIAATYIAAAVLGVVVFRSASGMELCLRVLIADVAATVLIYLVGLVVGNASVYDPYWSVAPIIICTGVVVLSGRLSVGVVLLLIAVWGWGLRLTVNWALTFTDLATQDWRYDNLKQQFPRAFPLVTLVGIDLFPTLMVYLGLLPAIAFIEHPAFQPLTVIGCLLCLSAATLQLVADAQMHRFRRAHPGQHLLIREGLWTNARHPNYLGEILMWWGVWLMMSAAPAQWYLAVGPLAITAMFVFVSIPMADRRNRTRPGWATYRAETKALIPWPGSKAGRAVSPDPSTRG